MERLYADDALKALSWLEDRAAAGGFTGYDVSGWRATVWIVHAMYENDRLPGGVTHDDVHRIELAAGVPLPTMIGDVNLDEHLAEVKVVGRVLGASRWPGPGWNRLRWAELAARLDHDPYALDAPPVHPLLPLSELACQHRAACRGVTRS